MKKQITNLLICPACLPKEHLLQLTIKQETEHEVWEGFLECKKCKHRYPIQDGLAILMSDQSAGTPGSQWRYEEKGVTSQYLWSHFRDLCSNKATESGSVSWTDFFAAGRTSCFDAGCSVGRASFEMARQGAFTIGCDLSYNFIKTARLLAKKRRHTFTLPLEGKLEQQFEITIPESWQTENLEFIIADALYLPFSYSSFDQIASLNLLDRVAYPLAHLYEMNRVAQDTNCSFLFADPFSWSETITPVEKWLGGTDTGAYPGRGIDNVRALLEGKDMVLQPTWQITKNGHIAWNLRSHCNHTEVITSQYLIAER